jgi:signal transduction histidine kinase
MPRPPSDNVLPGSELPNPDATSDLGWLNRMLRPDPGLHAEPERTSVEGVDRETAAKLDALVNARVAEIERARRAAEEAERAKTLFLANMTHELRTPVHAILSYAQLGRDATAKEEQREYFDRIVRRGQQLLNFLSDLLDLSRLEAGSMSLEFAPNDVEALARAAVNVITSGFGSKHLIVQIDRTPDCTSCRACVDAVLLGKLFDNLLSNAARYSPQGGKVRIVFSRSSVADGARQRPALEMKISDEGTSIPERELAFVFDKFVQSSGNTRGNAGGTGLGMAICREIVALHGGNIWASNNQGAGATFHVLLPLLEMSTGREAL